MEALITAIHLLIYSDDPVATRSFFRDVFCWSFVEEPDVLGGSFSRAVRVRWARIRRIRFTKG